MTRTHWRRPVPMGEAVSAALRRLGLETRFRQEQIWTVWSAVVGPQIARHAQPYAVRQGRLIVHVSDPVWLHHLSMMRHRVVAALNERLDTLVIRGIVLRVGELPDLPLAPLPHPSREAGTAELDPVLRAKVESALAILGDAPCMEAVRRLLLRAAQESRKTPFGQK